MPIRISEQTKRTINENKKDRQRVGDKRTKDQNIKNETEEEEERMERKRERETTTNKGEHKTKEGDKTKNTHRRLVLDPQCCCGRLLMGPMGSQMVWAPLPSKVSHEVDIFVRLFVPHIFGCRFASVNDLARTVLSDEYFRIFCSHSQLVC